MFRRLLILLGLAGIVAGAYRLHLEVAHNAVCNAQTINTTGVKLSNSCLNIVWPYIFGYSGLLVGGFFVICGLVLASRQRKGEMQYRRDLRRGKFASTELERDRAQRLYDRYGGVDLGERRLRHPLTSGDAPYGDAPDAPDAPPQATQRDLESPTTQFHAQEPPAGPNDEVAPGVTPAIDPWAGVVAPREGPVDPWA